MRARILIVEDELIIATNMNDLLERLGYCVLQVVSSGEEAIIIAEQDRPDLVLMDINLSGTLDGIQTATRIIAVSDIPIVYLTSHSQDEFIERAKLTHPFGYLIKPVKGKDLKVAIEMALYRHKLERQVAEHDQWLNSILEAFDDAVIATDSEGRIQFINSVAAQWTGLEVNHSEKIQLEKMLNLVNFENEGGDKSKNRLAINEGAINMWNHFPHLVTPNNRKIPVEISKKPVYNKQGDLQGFLYILKDISSFKQLQEELSQNRSKFHYLINHVLSAVLLFDREGFCMDANQKACQALAFSRDQMLNFSLQAIEPGFDEAQFQQHLQLASQSGPIPIKKIFCRKDKSTIPTVGVMGVWEKGDRTIVILIFRSAIPGHSEKEMFQSEEKEFEKTYSAINQIFDQTNRLYTSFNVFEG